MSADTQPNDLFLGLVASLQASAWMQLGKIMNPISGKVERNLERAQETIDLLGVIQEKTRGNLHPDEARLLEQILYELRMNFVEEQKQPESPGAVPESTSHESEGTEGPGSAAANRATAQPDPDSAGPASSTRPTEPS